MPQTFFLATTGIRSWSHEDIFSKEPVQRLQVIVMATNQAYAGINRTIPFRYQKCNLSHIVVYRNGPLNGTPVSTHFSRRICFNTLETLDYLDKGGHGITLDNYPKHFNLAFDLTSTQEESHDFIHPEITNCSISVQLTSVGAFSANVEIVFLGERSSTFYVNSERKVKKLNNHIAHRFDSDEISYLLGQCIHLKYYFYGAFAADILPQIRREGFIVATVSPSQHAGSHWMVLLLHEITKTKFIWQICLESR